MLQKFNGNRLKTARLYREMTIEDLADEINVSKQTISLYENNRVSFPFEKLLKLASVLKFPSEYFLQDDDFSINSRSIYFRSLLRTKKKERISQKIKMEHLAKIYDIMSEYLDFPALNLPEPKEYNSPEEAAMEIRSFWKLGEEPIKDLVFLFEKNGILFTQFETTSNDIDAFSHQVEVNGKSIVLVARSSNKQSAARLNFDLAHELGHILLHDWSDDQENISKEEFRKKEDEANAFASSFLLPKNSFTAAVSNHASDLEFYVVLKKFWFVSIAAMIHRSKDLGLINLNQYQYMIRKMQIKKWWGNEPLDGILKAPSPSLLREGVNLLLENKYLTRNELFKVFLDAKIPMEAQELENLMCLEKGSLTSIEDEKNAVIVQLKNKK